MGTLGGPNTVIDGLVLCLDAANNKSYSGTGSTWRDVSGNKNNGTLVNGPTFNSGSLYFDGIDDSASTPTSPSLESITTGISICFWVKLGATKNNYAVFFTKSGFATTLGIRGSDGFTVWYSNLGNWVAGYTSPRVLNNGNWAFMCYNYDGSTQRIFQNGVQILSRSTTGNFTTTSNSMVIANSTFDGQLGASYIYNRALSAQEVLQNYNATKSRFGL